MLHGAVKGNLIFVNQIGGQDELVFDGNSFVIHNDGNITWQGIDECITLDNLGQVTYKTVEIKPCPDGCFYNNFDEVFNTLDGKTDAITYKMLVLGLKDYVRKSGFKEVVIGSSGGIDSALTIALACDALGPENVHCIRMPSIFSSPSSSSDALELHKNLGCHDYEIPIDHLGFLNHINERVTDATELDVIENIADVMTPRPIGPSGGTYNPVADENIQARLRGMVIMHFSNAYGALPLTTGNKTELAVGYCTMYGDMNGGLAVISDVLKMQVYALAKLNGKIPQNILKKEPSAELAPDQKDSDSLLPYSILDPIVKAYIESYISDYDTYLSFKEKEKVLYGVISPLSKEDYDKMIAKIDMTEFKRRQAAPGIKISSVAFGTGRRIPIVKGR